MSLISMIISRGKKTVESIPEEKKKLLTESATFSIAEAYRSARTNLMFMRTEEKCQKIAVTSAGPSEGKTTNCINMAITMAQNDKRVLIIDADMRKPKLHRLMDEKISPGLSEYLANIADKVHYRSTQHHNLFILPAGSIPPNPAELLSSGRMKKLLDLMSEEFDYIFVDMPPLNLVTDAAVLASVIPGFILVVRAGRTQLDELKGAVSALEQVGAHIVGFLLNDMHMKGGSYKYRYGRYGRYGYRYKYASYSSKETESV